MAALFHILIASSQFQYYFILSSVLAALGFFLSGFYFSFVRPMGHRKMNQRLWGKTRERLVETRLFKVRVGSPAAPLLRMLKAVLGWSKAENLQRTLYQADIFCPPRDLPQSGRHFGLRGLPGRDLLRGLLLADRPGGGPGDDPLPLCGSRGTVRPPSWRARCRKAWTCSPGSALRPHPAVCHGNGER